MDMELDRFAKSVVETLAKRAANRCSNPDCNAITSGPSDDQDRAVTVGEAAHIYGARPGGARYNAAMTAVERNDITNAIWLCRNCHKMIDSDVSHFPAALLFEWRLTHEQSVSERLGKANDQSRRMALKCELEGFNDASYLARQIIIDKPDAWEYKLTMELLRSKCGPIVARWHDLRAGLYSKAVFRLQNNQAISWWEDRLTEISSFPPALTSIVNNELRNAWGPPGKAGSPAAILRACSLFEEACRGLLNWEENVRFCVMSPELSDLKLLFVGLGGRMLDQIAVIPNEMSAIFSEEKPIGIRKINIVIDLPEGWERRCQSVFDKILNGVKRGEISL